MSEENVEKLWGMDTNTYCMLLHLSQLLTVSGAGIILPIVMWAVNKDKSPEVDRQGKMAVNWIISLVIYAVICFILTFVVIGAFGLVILGICAFIFPIIGAIKANNGELFKYPMVLNIIK